VFLAQDETLEERDLNGDGDTGDKFVLGLLDATDAAAPVRSTSMGMSNQNEPLRAMARGPSDWLVAFLVDEAAQGTTNFNDPALFDPAWQPAACVGLEDSDDDDSVLFYIDFAAFASDPLNNPAVNTGLTGSTRIVAAPGGLGSPGFIGTLSLEFDENSCALNGDGDGTDAVFRFTEATTPVLPITDPSKILALDALVPGGALGLVELEKRFLVVVDEADDGRSYDGKSGQDNSLLGWIDPSLGASASYTFDHSTGGGGFFAGVSWLRASTDRSAVLMALEEQALGQPLSAGDTDINDSVPVVVNFDPDETDELIFVGPAIACDADDAGMSLAGSSFIYKVDEVADGRDWDLDGDSSDIVFLRTRRENTLDSIYVGRLLRFNGAQNQGQLGPDNDPLAVTDGQFGAGFLINEGVNQEDLNNDQDTTDRVVQFFRF